MSCGVAYRHSSDPTLLWLWSRLAAIALIRPLAWEPPHATGAAIENAKRQKKNEITHKNYILCDSMNINLENANLTYIVGSRSVFARG